MTCKTCGRPCALRPRQFYFRGRWFSGWVCIGCNALYENKDDSMFVYAAAQREEQS